MLSNLCIPLFICLGFSCNQPANSHNDFDENAWKWAGQYVTKYMDPTRSPCTEFFDHACGNFGPNDQPRVAADELTQGMFNTIKQAIARIKHDGKDTPGSERALFEFYNQCVAAIPTNKNSTANRLDAISDRLDDFESANVGQNLNPWRYIGFIKRELGFDFIISLVTDTFAHSRGSQLAITLDPYIERYPNWTSDFGISNPLFEKIRKTFQEIGSNGRQSVKVPLSKLHDLIPNVDWKTYFEEVAPPDLILMGKENLTVSVVNPNLITDVAAVVNEFRIDRNVKETIHLLLLERDLIDDVLPSCLLYVIRFLNPALVKLYFKHLGENITEWGQDIAAIQLNLVAAFRFLLNNVDWLDAEGKADVQEKVDNIRFRPGLPTWIDDEKRVMEKSVCYFFNRSQSLHRNKYRLKKIDFERSLRAAVSQIQEYKITMHTNAYYSPWANEIKVHFGYVSPPFFHIKYPLAVKYGALGAILAHELMHSLDSDGIYESPHSDDEWLNEEIFKEFEKRRSCLIRQYAQHCSLNHAVCISSNTSGENIADMDGIKVAYTAYKFAAQIFGKDPPIPSISNYTNDQLFFLAYARTWCSNDLAHDAQFNYGDTHSPSRLRVDVGLRNVPLFAHAFQCSVGSHYAPLKVCSVWGDMDEPPKKY